MLLSTKIYLKDKRTKIKKLIQSSPLRIVVAKQCRLQELYKIIDQETIKCKRYDLIEDVHTTGMEINEIKSYHMTLITTHMISIRLAEGNASSG
jgi:hypothetical protein